VIEDEKKEDFGVKPKSCYVSLINKEPLG